VVIRDLKNRFHEVAHSLGTEYKEIKKGTWVHFTAEIDKTVNIVGPCIVGANAQLRHCAYIRENVIIGNDVVVGNSCEVKNAILFNKVQVPHFNYVGDSIMGYKSHIGAGSILSNMKSNRTEVSIKVSLEETINTGLRKFGAIVGDEVEIGCNAVINPGTIIGRGSIIYPLSNPRGVIPAGVIYKQDGTIVTLRKEE
jgi:NDP-sugar pyrophosphorylase family protein